MIQESGSPAEPCEVSWDAIDAGQIHDSLDHGDDGDRRDRIVVAPVVIRNMALGPVSDPVVRLRAGPASPALRIRPD